jgi:hypothetical protein
VHRPNRRGFLRTVAGLTVLPARPGAFVVGGSLQPGEAGQSDRPFWLSILRRLAEPVLSNLAGGTLKARMPVEQAAGADRRSVTHLEAVGRLLAGIAPWLELHRGGTNTAPTAAEGSAGTSEQSLAARYADLARRAIAAAVDPGSPDYMNFTRERQPLVDAAFLAQGLLRAPHTLADDLDSAARRHLVTALESTRAVMPGFNNWLLFSAAVEAGLKRLGAGWDRVRVEYALRQHDQWYKGDGTYGDGPALHWDYYNSFVIHPMMLDVLDECQGEMPAWQEFAARELERARRYAAIQERLIAPDGSFPPVGRSIAYRFGAFHLLAQIALRRALPDGIAPAQVRAALTAVMRRSIDAPGTFDAGGWLRIGFCGHQPGIGENYISTGSLYLCAAGLLPLGLPASDEFWSAPPQPWTAAKAWAGQPFPIDHAL